MGGLHTKADIETLTDKFNIDLKLVSAANGDSLAMHCLRHGKNFTLAKYFMDKLGQGPRDKNQRGDTLLSLLLEQIGDQLLKRDTKSNDYREEYLNQLMKQFDAWLENDPSLAQEHFADGNTTLMKAILAGSPTLVKALIKKEANINEPNSMNGQSALHCAAQRSNREILSLLLGELPDLTTQDNRGNTPMHLLIAQRPTFTELMAIKGPVQKLDTLDDNGNSVLHLAVKGGDKNRDLIEALLEAGLDPFQANKQSQSALDIALERGNIAALVLISERLTPNDMLNHEDLYKHFEPHRAKMVAHFKRELGILSNPIEDPEGLIKIKRIDAVCHKENGFGLLCARWIMQDTHKEGSRVSSANKGNELFTELKRFKEGFLGQSQKSTETARVEPADREIFRRNL